MLRIARAIVVDYSHHLTQRGYYQYPVFDEDNDFKQYLCLLKKYSRKYGLKVKTYEDLWVKSAIDSSANKIHQMNG